MVQECTFVSSNVSLDVAGTGLSEAGIAGIVVLAIVENWDLFGYCLTQC